MIHVQKFRSQHHPLARLAYIYLYSPYIKYIYERKE